MKQIIQEIFNKVRQSVPGSYVANLIIARERSYRNWEADTIDKALAQSDRDALGNLVTASGLFAGLKWRKPTAVGSEFAPKIVGTYEKELVSIFEDWIANRGLTSIIDIGAAEGYYAVGFAMRRPDLPIYAFEANLLSHDEIRDLAVLNNCSKLLTVLGAFQADSWEKFRSGERPAILMDVDGAENEICDPEFVQRAASAHIVIEVHDFVTPDIGYRIEARFRNSHRIRRINACRRGVNEMPKNIKLEKSEWYCVTDEKRPMKSNYWLVCDPR